jgi:hypothetical protein
MSSSSSGSKKKPLLRDMEAEIEKGLNEKIVQNKVLRKILEEVETGKQKALKDKKQSGNKIK